MGGGPATATPTATATVPGAATPTFTATPTASATPRDQYEPNNSMQQATAIQAGRDYLAYIDSGSDADYFSFAGSDANALVWAALTGPSGLPDDYDLFLFRPDGSLGAASAHGGTTNEYILDWPVSGQTGTYYLEVAGYNHAANANATYQLRLELHGATPTATPTRTATATPTATATRTALDTNEPNNSFEQATLLAPGAVAMAYLDTRPTLTTTRSACRRAGGWSPSR